MVQPKRATVVIALVVLLGLAGGACSLANIRPDGCSDSGCSAAFGLGSTCVDGYCGDPATCDTGFDCRAAFGGGACVDGGCRATFEWHPACDASLTEPPDLLDRQLVGDTAPVIVGSLFRLNDESDPYRAAAARLVAREVKQQSGVGNSRDIAMITCDVGGPADEPLAGDERTARIRSLIDFFAGTLGAPFIVGPTTSSDALTAVSHLVASDYPTVLISPSATSPALTTVVDRLGSDRPGLFWRTAPSDAFQGAKLATDVIGQYPVADCGTGMGGGGGGGGLAAVNKVAIIHIKDAYGSGLAKVFFEHFVGGSREAEFVPFSQGDDLKTIVDDLLASDFKPDGFLIVAIDSKNTLSLVRALSDYVLQPGQEHRKVYLTDGSKSDLLLAVDPVRDPDLHSVVFERTVGTAPASPDPNGALYKAFETSIEKEFSGVVANEHSFIAHTYDAAYVASAGLVYAMTKTGSSFTGEVVAEGMGLLSSSATDALQPGLGFADWPELKAAMQNADSVVNIRGVTGDLDFDESGEPTANLEVWQPCSPVFCPGAVACFAQVGTI